MSIKDKLEKGIYLLENIPRIMDMSGYEGIFINKNLPYPNEIESIENMDWPRDKVQTHKLKATSYGDWGLDIGMINTKHFENRQKLDEMLLLQVSSYAKKPCQDIERISIQKALDFLGIKLSINMDFYLKNKNELESDLMRKVSDLDLKNEHIYKKIEQELFYKQMLKLFGDDEKAAAEDHLKIDDDSTLFEKSFILREFHKYLDGNYMYGSAKRGDYYLLFNFVS
jgi:hypothetical protein